ncbi:MAG TPA: hypothetical protein VFU40_01165 [Gemmatimonadales bacterium]|nr:hypothetical protein [Gemmatimonadales bacterium]
MRKVTLSIPVVVLALCLGAAQLPAQEPGNSTFQWYVGGHGGILNFETPSQGREVLPLGGAHLLITARRTGLMLSVEQAFGSDEPSSYTFQMFDPTGVLVDQQTVPVTFNYLRKYSATLLAFPIKGPLTPFFGIGVGILHTGGHTPDDEAARAMGSSGFGSLVGGLNFKVSHFSAFGQYQVTTGPRTQVLTEMDAEGNLFVASGNLYTGATHTLSAGLRFNLGNARERAHGGGY